MKAYLLAAVVAVLGSSACADPLSPDAAGDPMRETARGS